MPKNLKDKIIDDIPSGIRDKVATEDDVLDIDTMRTFLKEKGHPVVDRWKKDEEQAKAEVPVSSMPEITGANMLPASNNLMPVNEASMGLGGIKLVLKDAKISIEKIEIVRRK